MECGSACRGLFLQTLQAFLYGVDGVAEVHGIVGEDNLSGLVALCAHGDDLRGCRSGVNADGDVSVALVHGIDGCGILCFVLQPSLVVGVRLEERSQLVGVVGICGTDTA